MLPTVKLGDADISRLIMGGNIISGTSHISPDMDREMQEFYTMPRIQQAFDTCAENGINTVQLRIDAHIIRALMEHRVNGGKLNWIAQTAPEHASLENNLRMAAKIGPVAVYLHGSIVDYAYQAGEFDRIKKDLKTLRYLGVPVGLGTHMPEVLLRAEAEEWGADWYMTCVYDIMKLGHVSSAVTGKFANDEVYDEEDRALMFNAIRRTPKPCLAFKILGAARRCTSDADRETAISEAYASIKDTDGCVVGFFQKHGDQITQVSRYVRDILAT